MKDKRGLSAVIGMMILVMLVISLVVIVWGIVNNLTQKKIGESESCFGIFEKVTIDDAYTCYNSTSQKLEFALSIKDITVDKVIVSIFTYESKTSTKFEISNSPTTVDNLKSYPDGDQVKLPAENSAETYVASGFPVNPDSIQIAPVINNNMCEVSDTLHEIQNCALFS